MKKIYEKPEVELTQFALMDAIASVEDDDIGDIIGSAGQEEW